MKKLILLSLLLLNLNACVNTEQIKPDPYFGHKTITISGKQYKVNQIEFSLYPSKNDFRVAFYFKEFNKDISYSKLLYLMDKASYLVAKAIGGQNYKQHVLIDIRPISDKSKARKVYNYTEIKRVFESWELNKTTSNNQQPQTLKVKKENPWTLFDSKTFKAMFELTVVRNLTD